MRWYSEDVEHCIEVIADYCKWHECHNCKYSHYNMLHCVFRERPERWVETLDKRNAFIERILAEQEEEEMEIRND